MGNQSSALNDDEVVNNISNFDHNYKMNLKIISGDYFQTLRNSQGNDGEKVQSDPEGQLICKSTCMEIIIDSIILTDVKCCVITYTEITEVGWDHSLCEVKFSLSTPGFEIPEFVILHVPMSVELESELQQRFRTLASDSGTPTPPFAYVGVFAGETKPKPFQRKRPNISRIPAGKLPVLSSMREIAVRHHFGSCAPCPIGTSRRITLALEHIFEGFNSFPLLVIPGDYGRYKHSWTTNSRLAIMENKIRFYPDGLTGTNEEISFDCISFWVLDSEDVPQRTSGGIRFYFTNDAAHGAGVLLLEFPFIRDIKHTLEFFWNRHQLSKGLGVMMGSTHGRPLETIHTLGGVIPAPSPPLGQIDIVDSDGLVVRPGSRVKPGARASRDMFRRANSLNSAFSHEPILLPPETKVRGHWTSIVKHQGWLLKKGGVGVGVKQWLKRYFVLYSTSQGHFLVYYSDILECPMFSTEKLHRNIIDLCKVTFIRPGSSRGGARAGEDVAPPHSFEIQTIEREWTLCAESQENAQRWLQILTRAVDEDVAIIPDEIHTFAVKAKKDPTAQCVPVDYSTSIQFSAYAVSLFAPDTVGGSANRLVCRWIYTDFYKWSIVTQNGKLALLLSVFIDETFAQKIEFLFRTTEALRLAGTLEYCIEKFMTTMHLELELNESLGFPHNEDIVESESVAADERKMPHPSAPKRQQQKQQEGSSGEEHDTGNGGSLLGFGSDDLGLAASSESLSFFTPSMSPSAPPVFTAATLPPSSLTPPNLSLSPAQLETHRQWYLALLCSPSAPTPAPLPFYDDGTLQISCTVEIRGSQGRITLLYRNNSPTDTIYSLACTMPPPAVDAATAAFLRSQVSPLQSHLVPLELTQQQLMFECLQPSPIRPNVLLSYRAAVGLRKLSLPLPVTVLSFNSPLALSLNDFQLRWEMLHHAGQELIEVLRPQRLLTFQSLTHIVSTMFHFHLIDSPEEHQHGRCSVLGAASLRTASLNPQTREPVTLGCLLKIDLDLSSNSLRIVCRTVLPLATSAISSVTKALLS